MKKIQILFFLFFSLVSSITQAQNADSKMQQILQEKRVENLNNNTMEGYIIQIYFGMSQTKASNTRGSFATLFPDTPTKMFYKQPEWKVHVGNFRTKLEAERMLVLIRGEFANAFVKKPLLVFKQ